MRDEHRLQRHMCFVRDTLQEVANQPLVRVSTQAALEIVTVEVRVDVKLEVKRDPICRTLKREIPNDASSPIAKVALANDKGARTMVSGSTVAFDPLTNVQKVKKACLEPRAKDATPFAGEELKG